MKVFILRIRWRFIAALAAVKMGSRAAWNFYGGATGKPFHNIEMRFSTQKEEDEYYENLYKEHGGSKTDA